MIGGLLVATALAAVTFVFCMLSLAVLHKALPLLAFNNAEFVVAGVFALLVFGAFIWRMIEGSTVQEEVDRFLDVLNDPGSSTN
jgi:hypothetical protein